MGCPPMKRGWSAAATMAVFTPLTSLTTASGRRRRSSRTARHVGHRGGRGGDEDDLGLEVVAGLVEHAARERLGEAIVVGVECR